MAKILQFPTPQGRFAASIDLFLEPDGSVLARLRDMPPSLIDTMGGEPHDKLLKLALWTQQGAVSLAEQANSLRPLEEDI